ncbi:tricarboxylate transport protein B, mitochondrial-like [Drosophila nasuta]|uniref:tricarboxylate transport protein B, mitochondrial-like n=1 Tax=Drosophila nasuta TaxID=42062 RepID=UPI00295F362E|nr:tricarboxylate transport protein B, mitochondrial-like [Drosophila nasuta]
MAPSEQKKQEPRQGFTGNHTGEHLVAKGAIAGGIAGGLEALLKYPTYFIKHRLQDDPEHKKYAGTLDCVKKTIRRHGVLGLYRGVGIMLVSGIATVASRFGAYEFFCDELHDENGKISMLNVFISGLLAGVTEAVVAVTPLRTIRLKLINDMHLPRPRYHGMLHGVTHILRREGIRGIYRGVSITVLRQGTNQAIRFFLMITQKEMYMGDDENSLVPMPLLAIFGVISGAANVLGHIPMKWIQKRIQAAKSQKYKKVLDNAATELQVFGPGKFFMTSTIQMLRVGIDVAVTFMVYQCLMENVFDHLWN